MGVIDYPITPIYFLLITSNVRLSSDRSEHSVCPVRSSSVADHSLSVADRSSREDCFAPEGRYVAADRCAPAEDHTLEYEPADSSVHPGSSADPIAVRESAHSAVRPAAGSEECTPACLAYSEPDGPAGCRCRPVGSPDVRQHPSFAARYLSSRRF